MLGGCSACSDYSMASSKNSKTEKKKSKDVEISKTARKERDLEKEKKNKTKKKKKLKLSNGNVKDDDKVLVVPSSSTESQQRQQEDNTVVSNGRTSGANPKKSKRKQQDHEEEDEVEGKEDAKTHKFPMNRIRTIIRGEDPDLRVSQEAIFAINKASEKFLEQFTQDAYTCSISDRKKYLAYKHLAYVVNKQRRYDFLSDFVPEKVKAEDALRERNSGGDGGGG